MTENTTAERRGGGSCDWPGCEGVVALDDTLRWCAERREYWRAVAEEEEQELALSILRPWVEATEHIGNDTLTEIMQQALSDLEHQLRQSRAAAKRAEAALEA